MSTEPSPQDLTNRFMDLYTEIEEILGRRSGAPPRSGMGVYVDILAKSDRVVRRYKAELDAFRTLRNAIAHTRYQNGRPIAAPYVETVESIERLRDALKNPPLVQKFMHLPVSAHPEDPLRGHLEEMTRKSFSQMPVTHDGRVVGLLTTNAIARWVGAHMTDQIMDLDVAVADVLTHSEDHDAPLFLRRRATAQEACDLLTGPLSPQAIIVTESGQSSELPVGIVTISDVPAMLQATGLGATN